MNELIQYKCKTCEKTFFLLAEEVNHSKEESDYITCPYHGKHKNIIVTNRYGSLKDLKEVMEKAEVFKKVNGRYRKI